VGGERKRAREGAGEKESITQKQERRRGGGPCTVERGDLGVVGCGVGTPRMFFGSSDDSETATVAPGGRLGVAVTIDQVFDKR
jgi:hypothetical protein